MKRFSRWTWAFFALALLVLAGGAAAALLVWQARSSSTQEFLDAEAATEITLNVVDNTAVIAEDWLASDLSGGLSSLSIAQQESLALLAGEVSRTEDLVAQVEEPPQDMDWEPPQDLLEALAFLSQAQAELEYGLEEFGYLLTILQPLEAGEAYYVQGREALISAVESHNQAVDTDPTSFSQAIQEASNAAAALQESLASLEESITALGEVFGTAGAAEKNLSLMRDIYREWKEEISDAGAAGLAVICHRFQQPLAEELGFEVVGMFGPAPIEASQLNNMSALQPDLIIDNWHKNTSNPTT